MVCFCSPQLPSSWDPSCLFPPSLLPLNGILFITDIMQCSFLFKVRWRDVRPVNNSKSGSNPWTKANNNNNNNWFYAVGCLFIFIQIKKGRIISCRTSSKCFIKCHNVFLDQVNSPFFSNCNCIKFLYFFSTETSLNKSLSSSCLFSLVFDCSSLWKFLFQTFTF